MSERIYQVIIGVLVFVILVGGALMLASQRAATDGTSATDSSEGDSKESMDFTTPDEADSDSASSADDSSAVKPQTGTFQTTMADGDSVNVVDQSAGKSAVIQSISLSKLAWVAIRDKNGWILGAERLEAGDHANVTVTLLRATMAGTSYEAVLYVDDGDRAFDLHKDSLVMKSDGSAVSAAFLTK